MDNSLHAANIFNKHATQYQDKFMDTSMYHDTFDLFCGLIKNQNSEILELACGPGNITRYLLYRRPDFKILGLDLAPNMVRLAKANNPQADFELMDCRDIYKIPKKYDAVMCGFCLPYLSKPETMDLIKDASLILKPGGVLYLSTMEDDYSKSGLRKGSAGDEIYMHYYREADLVEILQNNHFTTAHLQRKQYQEKPDQMTTDMIIIAVKNHQ